MRVLRRLRQRRGEGPPILTVIRLQEQIDPKLEKGRTAFFYQPQWLKPEKKGWLARPDDYDPQKRIFTGWKYKILTFGEAMKECRNRWVTTLFVDKDGGEFSTASTQRGYQKVRRALRNSRNR